MHLHPQIQNPNAFPDKHRSLLIRQKYFLMSHLYIYFLQVQNAALAAMKDEMLELASRFTRVTKERDYMEKALNRLQVSSLKSLCPILF